MDKNKELTKQTKRRYYLANKEKLDIAVRDWKRRHSEEISQRRKAQYDPKKNREIKLRRVDKMRKEMRAHYLRVKDTKKFRDLHREHGWRSRGFSFTVGQYDELFESQGGKCALCQKVVVGSLCVDHCHDCGKVRGLLCHKCNRSLPSPERIQVITRYLKIDPCLP